MSITSIVFLLCPEMVRQLVLRFAIFTPNDWINKPAYLKYIKAKAILSGITAAVLLFIGFWNVMK